MLRRSTRESLTSTALAGTLLISGGITASMAQLTPTAAAATPPAAATRVPAATRPPGALAAPAGAVVTAAKVNPRRVKVIVSGERWGKTAFVTLKGIKGYAKGNAYTVRVSGRETKQVRRGLAPGKYAVSARKITAGQKTAEPSLSRERVKINKERGKKVRVHFTDVTPPPPAPDPTPTQSPTPIPEPEPSPTPTPPIWPPCDPSC